MRARVIIGLGAALATLLAVSAAGLWQLSKSRSFQIAGEIIARFETDAPLVALTLDDGPSRAHTAEVLRILDEKDVRATFFVTGREVRANPYAAQAIAEAGHELGNHSFSHQRMVLISRNFVLTEIGKTDARIRSAGYEGDILFRPPFGKKLFTLPRYLAEKERKTIMWDVEADSGARADDSAAIVAHVSETARPGSIVLMHVMYESRAATREALPGVIDALRAKGLEPVTVSELLARADTE